MMRIDGKPVIFCFISWMRDYDGVTDDDVPVWDSARRPKGYVKPSKRSPYYLGESNNFSRRRCPDGKRRAFGFVQGDFNTKRLGGSKVEMRGALVIWCASDPIDDNRVKLVGWYDNATVYGEPRKDLSQRVAAEEMATLPPYEGYITETLSTDAVLLKEIIRPALPVVPGQSEHRWHSTAKHWFGDDSPTLAAFIRRWLRKDLRRAVARAMARLEPPIARKVIMQTIRDRQGQHEFRQRLLIAYQDRCAITRCATRELLDACHIHPARHADSHHGSANGILLRTDLHTLFDYGLLAIDPDHRTVWISPLVTDPAYRKLHGMTVETPDARFPPVASQPLHARWLERKIE